MQSITSARFVCAECDPVFELCAACFVSGVELRDVGHLATHRYAVAPTLAMPIVPSYVSHLAPPLCTTMARGTHNTRCSAPVLYI